jgi:hypothetical protein
VPKRKYEQPTSFLRLVEELRDRYEDGFEIVTPNPVTPSFVDELRQTHYPELPEFEVDPDLRVTEVDGELQVATS